MTRVDSQLEGREVNSDRHFFFNWPLIFSFIFFLPRFLGWATQDPAASYDVNGLDDDPEPRYDMADSNRHGTRCAGEVAAMGNNSICAVGVAFNAREKKKKKKKKRILRKNISQTIPMSIEATLAICSYFY